MITNRRVLLLNASYEALGAISTPRAVRLIWKGSAELVERDGDRVLRSQRFEFPAPSVVRLIEYIDVRGRQRRSSSKRTRILARDGYRCQYCGTRGGTFDLTIDHILPVSRGGSTSPDNLVSACFACNQRKGDRTPEEARMPLLKNPAALTYGIDRAILCHEAESRREWRKYLFLGDAEGVA
jgi:5-methylcytosine-specific restriction endonuclease McrA